MMIMEKVTVFMDYYTGAETDQDDATSSTTAAFATEHTVHLSDSEYDNKNTNVVKDSIFSAVRKTVKRNNSIHSDGSIVNSHNFYDNEANGITTLTYGFIPKACYDQPARCGDILGVCHNPRSKQFLLVDNKGITGWKYGVTTEEPVSRQLNYPPYQYRLYNNLIYARRHNVYFCLGKDSSLKILNHQFEETYTVDANLRNVLFLVYNHAKEELITGGVGGSKIWKFVQVIEDKGWQQVKAMSNYKLYHKYTLQNVGGGWVKRVELDYEMSHMYCCSENDLFAYDLNNGAELFSLKRAHDMSITSCKYSKKAQMIVTSSMDSTVKCWIMKGGLVHTFLCHSKPVTQLLCHPDTSALMLTCSMDCTVKLLSLDTLSVLYSQ